MKRKLRIHERILAIDLHPKRYGYAVLEAPEELLDWGVKRINGHCPRQRSLSRGLRSLMEVWSPSLVAMRQPLRAVPVRTRKLLRDLTDEVTRYGIPVIRISQGPENLHHPTKDVLASSLVRQFPFLAHMLPRKRRIWESEDYRISIFVAIALALAVNRPCNANH